MKIMLANFADFFTDADCWTRFCSRPDATLVRHTEQYSTRVGSSFIVLARVPAGKLVAHSAVCLAYYKEDAPIETLPPIAFRYTFFGVR